MAVYFISYFVLLGAGFALHITKLLESKAGKILYMSLVWLTLTLIGGMRSVNISYDGYAYKTAFDYFANTPWKMPWSYSYFMEYGFYVFCKLISVFGGTHQSLLFLSSGFIVFAICRFLYKHSDHLMFSTLLLLSYPYFYTSFDLIRYYMALSVVLLAFDFVLERKFVPYLVCILIAMLFHKMAVIMLALFWLPQVKWNFIAFGIVGAVTAAATLFPQQIASVFSVVFNDYQSYVSGSNTHWFGSFSGGIKTAFMYVLLLVISVLAFQNKDKSNGHNNLCLGFMIIETAAAVFFINASIAIRLLVAFLPYMSVGISSLLGDKGCHNQVTQVLLRYVTVLICVAYHAFLVLNDWQNIVPYTTF